MLMLPSSLVAIELGVQIQEAARNARLWTEEYHRLIEVVWEECDVRGWRALEMTYPFGKVVPDGWEIVEEVPDGSS